MRIKKSLFNLTHEVKLTCNMGNLVPCICQEVIPGDSWRLRSDMVLRLMPLIAPMMHRVDCYIHYFYVPTRLLWREFDKFLTGGKDGTATVAHPYITNDRLDQAGQDVAGSLSDYLGLPVGQLGSGSTSDKFSALPFRAYALVYNEWYRDENLINEVGFSDGNGEDTTTNLELLKRAWRKDYFTSALPWAQRGNPVQLPIDGIAKVTSNAAGDEAILPTRLTSSGTPVNMRKLQTAAGTSQSGNAAVSAAQGTSAVKQDTKLQVDLSEAAAGITVNDLRWAVVVQKFLERNARGIRFIEFLKNHFNVVSSDARLQRPEYIGGGKLPIVIGEVLQTSSTDSTSPQGNMAGKGVGAAALPGFRHFFEEQGFVLGILSIMPKASYQQGVSRMWTRFSRYDQFFPEFANLGEQEILNRELYYGSSSTNEQVFGYAPRYQEYRSIPSTVHGEFRSTMNYWHLGRIFENAPVLGQTFVECTPSERVFAVEDNSNKCICDILHHIQAVRPLPRIANPGVLL